MRSADLIAVAEAAFAKRYGDAAALPAEAQNIDMTLQIIDDVRRTVQNLRDAKGGLASVSDEMLLAGCRLRETMDCMTQATAAALESPEDEIF
ncbi:hypothetical protein [Poseidonocella sedimentorum]|nr:hypothetical protein [Poseidonocella sedimentorum]